MKPLVRFATAIGVLLGGAAALSAQNFNGSDDFSSASGYWTDGATANGGMFAVSSGVLVYVDSGVPAGQSSSATRYWSLNAGSYTSDWQVQMQFSIGLMGVPTQVSALSLLLQNSGDPTDRAELTLQLRYEDMGIRYAIANFYTDGSGGGAVQVGTMVEPVMQVTYVAATHELTLASSAYGFMANMTSAVIDGAGLNWGMGPGDTFILGLRGSTGATAGATAPLEPWQLSVDNFTAIPEPSAYAAGLGLVALLGAILRRRLCQE